jgi:hypothetical protein
MSPEQLNELNFWKAFLQECISVMYHVHPLTPSIQQTRPTEWRFNMLILWTSTCRKISIFALLYDINIRQALLQVIYRVLSIYKVWYFLLHAKCGCILFIVLFCYLEIFFSWQIGGKLCLWTPPVSTLSFIIQYHRYFHPGDGCVLLLGAYLLGYRSSRHCACAPCWHWSNDLLPSYGKGLM